MNYTEHIDLSQIEANDKPTWLNMYNSDMRKIDNAVGDLMTTTSSVSGTLIPELIKDVDNLQQIAAKNTSDIAINTSSIGALKLEDAKLATDIDTLDKREAAHYDALSGSADVNKQAIKDIQDQQIVFQANLQTTRNLAANNASSINKLQGRVTILEDNYTNNTSDIDNLRVDVDNLKTETDTLDTTTRQHDNDIANLKTSVNANTTNIGSIDSRVQTLEVLPTRMDSLENTATELRTDVDKNAGDIAANDADITALQTKTANITNGVNVPFGFGTTADGERGYEKADGTIESFGTSSDIAEINSLIGEINNKITALNTKTANIRDGKALPFSLAIESAGGAYGYIKNGETGVTPFLTSDDVGSIVNITPIETKVKNIDGSPNIARSFSANNNEIHVNDLYVAKLDSDTAMENPGFYVKNDAHLTVTSSMGLGVDSNGNYGYIKAGADTVTPFMPKTKFVIYSANSQPVNFQSEIRERIFRGSSNTLLFFTTINSDNLRAIFADGTINANAFSHRTNSNLNTEWEKNAYALLNSLMGSIYIYDVSSVGYMSKHVTCFATQANSITRVPGILIGYFSYPTSNNNPRVLFI